MTRRLSPETKPHGTVSTYTNHRCRCDLCTHAMTVYQRGRRATRRVLAHAKAGIGAAA